jgi:predicted permease
MPRLVQDVRYAVRQLRKAPGYALTAMVTLALGIGATTAIFTLVYSVLLRSLPVADPGNLWRVGSHNECCFDGGYAQTVDYTENGRPDFSLFSYPAYEYLRDHTPAVASMAAYQAGKETLTVRRQGSNGVPESAMGTFVSGNAFATLGVGAYLGRTLTPSDDRRGAPPAAVISYRDWQQNYGGNPNIVGAPFLFNGIAFTIVGVLPPDFYGAELGNSLPDYYVPLADEPMLEGEHSVLDLPQPNWLDIFARLAPGARVQTARMQLNLALQQWLHSHYADMSPVERKHLPEQNTTLTPGGAGITQMQSQYASGLHLLMAVAGFVLLIACANIANLMLARGLARRQGTSVRLAVGASRRRLIGQALVESIVLSLLGGAAGLLVAYGGTRAILHLAFADSLSLPISAAPSLPVLGFAFATALVTGMLFGIVPAVITSHTNPVEALRGANRSTQAGAALPQKALVVLQAAVSLVLLSAAGLLTHSLNGLESRSWGFHPEGRTVAFITQDPSLTKREQFAAFYRDITDRLRALPGVQEASYALYSPMQDSNWSGKVFVAGHAPSPDPDKDSASYNRIGPDYFSTVGTAILRGRSITQDDVANGRPVAVINEAFARKFFGSANPIGRHLGYWEQGHAGDFEIVGICENTRYSVFDLRNPVRAMWFSPLSYWGQYSEADDRVAESRNHFAQVLVLRSSLPVSVLGPQIKQAVNAVDPNVAVQPIVSMPEQVRNNFTQQSLVARLAGLFGSLALVLASIGLYGVTAYTVERRTGEIGIRMALGANRASVLRMVLRGAFAQVLVGLAIGIPAALVAARLISTQLYGVSPWNPVVLLGTALVLAGAAFVAALLPARRAAGIEPVIALRAE